MSFDRRAYQRQYAARRREAQRRAIPGDRCPADGFQLEYVTDGAGKVLATCYGCERRRLLRCMDCGSPVEGRSWRCPSHKAARQQQHQGRYKREHRAEINRRAKLYGRRHREERIVYKRAWRKANPLKVMIQKRRARLAGKPNGYATREKYLAYQRAYRAANGEALRAKDRARRQRDAA